MASELAREIIAQSKPRDRPSKVCIVCYCSGGYEKLSITAPIENGKLVFQIELVAEGGGTLQYDAVKNLEGAAWCVEGVINVYGDGRAGRAELYRLRSDGSRSSKFSQWCLEQEYNKEDEEYVEKVQCILKTLLVE